MRLAGASTSRGGADPLRPQRPAGLGRGAVLALMVHGVLLLALALGVSWRASEPTGASAELWAAVPEFAAAAPVAPPPPAPTPQPVQVVKPPLPTPKPEPKAEPQPQRDAEIAIEKARREKERELEKTKEREREKEKEKDRLARAEAEKKKLQAQLEEQRKKLAAATEKAEQQEQERNEKFRQDSLKRMQGLAGATGGETATGSAARDAAPSDSYGGRIKARVKPNIVFTEAIIGKPMASVEVRAAPDGTIIGRRLVKPSGDKAWDDAVLRAIDRTEILPRDIDGRVPSPITIDFTP